MAKRAPKPPKIYSLKTMPKVDAHLHIRPDGRGGPMDDKAGSKMIRIMNQAGIDVCINLTGTPPMSAEVPRINKKWKGRILTCPAQFRLKNGLWWNKKDLKQFAEDGCAGIKIWAQYDKGTATPSFIKKVGYQAEYDLPLIGWHVVDPPQGNYWQPSYWDRVYDAEKVIKANPNVTIIMAHGFWLMNEDDTLEVLGKFFDTYPHLNVDISAVFQWWDPPRPTFSKLRKFILKYKDRILYGTDGNPSYSKKEHYQQTYDILERKTGNYRGFFGGGNTTNDYVQPLGLPLDVLNYIYWWNAARLIPQVKKSLGGLGYMVGK
jgi:hypothetical protein